MKKVIAVILALGLCLSICSCGKGKGVAEEASNVVETVGCIQIDKIVTQNKTYDISYSYRSDGLIQQYIISYATLIDDTLYHYENTYDIVYDSQGNITKVTETACALDEDIVNEFDWTHRYSSDGELVKRYFDSFNMTFDETGFMASAEDIAKSRTNRYENTYDLEKGTGRIVGSDGTSESWDYTFSIVMIPASNQKVVMNIMSAILLTF